MTTAITASETGLSKAYATPRSGEILEKAHIMTERLKKLKDEYLDSVPMLCPERSRFFTDYSKQSDGESIAIRRAKAFKYILERISTRIGDHELIVGSQTKYVRGTSLYPEFSCDWIRDEIDTLSNRESQAFKFGEEERKMILEDVEYWEGKSVYDKAKAMWKEMWGDRVEDALEAHLFADFSRWPQGRMSVDYPKVLRMGLNGLIKEAKERRAKLDPVGDIEYPQKKFFLDAVVTSCEAVIAFAKRYANLAREMVLKTSDPARRKELEKIAEICDWVPANPARTFYEALQSLWFTHLSVEIENCSAGFSPGRFDQYMFPFYWNDIVEGRLTREEAAELLGCLWIKFTEIERIKDLRFTRQGHSNYQNLTIGGQTVDGRDAVNELSFLILDVTEALKVIQPTISVRYFDGLSEEFLVRAGEVVKSGGGMPAFFNDKAALASFPHYGISLREAREYVPIGCVERGLPTTSLLLLHTGFLNLPKCLELALNNGIDPCSGKHLGLATGDAKAFNTLEDVIEALKKQAYYGMETMVMCANTSYSLHASHTPVPFNSALMNDCIDRAKDISQGGVRYTHFPSSFPSGMVNTANSLTAMRKLVFEEKKVTMAELLDALAVNFEGKEELRQKLAAVPKYGNDNDYADEIVANIYQWTMEMVPCFLNPFGKPLTPAYAGITVHYFFGAKVGALPDGRKASTPLADGTLSAFPGTDVCGPTAVVKSAAKVDALMAFSTLFNLKFHPSALSGRDQIKKFLALIKTYFDLYGWHIQFNVVSRETLLDAKKHPEKYRDLVVRVAGFSVFWVDLTPAIQDEIIARTEHSL